LKTFDEQLRDGDLTEIFQQSQNALDGVIMEIMEEIGDHGQIIVSSSSRDRTRGTSVYHPDLRISAYSQISDPT
jgi:hypothetical protein